MDQRQPSRGQPVADRGAGRVRKLTAALALAVVLLVGGLAALPFLASQPRPAPDLVMTSIGGEATALSSLRGQPVLVSFWSTSCGTCLTEMPALVDLHRRYGPLGLRTFAVAMSHDRPETVASFARTRGLPFEVVFDETGAVARGFSDTQVTPTKFLIDGSGNIVRIYAGFTDFADLRQRIEGALGG